MNRDSPANDTNLAAEVKALREALLQTQKQIAAQQRKIEALKARSKDGAIRSFSAPDLGTTTEALEIALGFENNLAD